VPEVGHALRLPQGECRAGDHLPQLLHNLWVTGAAWCDFVSFDPRLSRWQAATVRGARAARRDRRSLAYEKCAQEVSGGSRCGVRVRCIAMEMAYMGEQQNPDELGALWIKQSEPGRVHDRLINGQPVVVFRNTAKRTGNQPLTGAC
jgi:hypothetical protein